MNVCTEMCDVSFFNWKTMLVFKEWNKLLQVSAEKT